MSQPPLNDFELAQLLAFEEAGLPAELALHDVLHEPSTKTRHDEEGANSSPLPVPQAQSNDGDVDEQWVGCFCGERVHVLELDAHADMHAQENLSGVDIDLTSETRMPQPLTTEHHPHSITKSFTTSIPESLRNVDQAPNRTPTRGSKKRRPSLKEIFLGTSASPKSKSPYKAVSSKQGKTRRLGRAELGPFAHEHQMPAWLHRMLQEGAKVTITNRIGSDGTLQRVETIANETPGLVPVLARLSQLDKTVERAFYCSPDVCHVAKMPKEGGFCGYRNIQMMVSYIQAAGATGSSRFPGRIPNILKVQDLIEQAWDMGFNSIGRVETGGIRLTRKYIGTPEAQALFMSLDVPCEAAAYTSTKSVEADETMMCAVCEYFDDESTEDNDDKVVITEKPPIYFQHPGHSMTIVGVECRSDGLVNLVVFDPMFNPSVDLKRLALSTSRNFKCNAPEKLMKAHRRGGKYLSKYRAFELLKLTSSTPSSED
ncbi:hypothetical protein LTR84_008009 [Exophiala bonariae]|uniref:UFSP1/2/DUB catalytic domain-containing protein n=1 Tax=Exophiala bonariae TaxID=1690606 RepID=A0AAV9NLP4_9EURO|nr:hypothetical protein LTR84_008009 [Exophiala bonariae]